MIRIHFNHIYVIALRAIYYVDQLGEECVCHFPGGFTSSPPTGPCLAKLSHGEREKRGDSHCMELISRYPPAPDHCPQAQLPALMLSADPFGLFYSVSLVTWGRPSPEELLSTV